MPKYDIVFIVSELVSGENMVLKLRNCDALQRVDAWFTAFWFPIQRFDGAETAVGDINHSFSGLICGVFKYKQPVFRQRYKVLRTQSTTFLIRLPTFPILISCFPILFNRSETIFPDFPTTFRHFPTQFPHFQTRIPPLPHTTTPFS